MKTLLREAIETRDLEPMPPLEALAFFRSLVPMLGVDPHRWWTDLRRRAFTLARASNQEMLSRVQDILRGRLETGERISDAPEEIEKTLDLMGAGAGADRSYTSMVVRTNLMDSFAQGLQNELNQVADTFPVWKYSAVGDNRTRPTHAARSGQYYPSSVPFTAVRGTDVSDVANCRCCQLPISKWDWAELKAQGHRLADGYSDPTEG